MERTIAESAGYPILKISSTASALSIRLLMTALILNLIPKVQNDDKGSRLDASVAVQFRIRLKY
jgi:hypothetical protein